MSGETRDQQDTLLLVDGHNLLFQMFYGMPARIVGKDGQAIQGVLGFVGALIRILAMTAPTHLAVLFDGAHENARKTLSADYKANRVDYSQVPQEDNPFSQLPGVCRALDFMGIRHTEVQGGETDDVIAAYVRAYGTGRHIVIASFDSDFFQLIGSSVSVLRYRGDKTMLCDTVWLRDKYDIAPGQYADFKALTGDSADNIRGAPGIGPKTAAKLLHQFGTLENLLDHASEIPRPSWREAVLNSADRLRVNYQLIHLGGSAPLPFSLEQLAYRCDGAATTQVLRGIGLK